MTNVKDPSKKNKYGTTESALECWNLCQKTKGCGWFNWDDEKNCWLKTSRGEEAAAPEGVSGPKFCEEGTNAISPTLLTLSV